MKLDCAECGSKTAVRLYWGASGRHCNECRPSSKSFHKPNLHFRSVNKSDSKMTYADQMHIKTRHIGQDGMVHAAPRWESKDL